MSDPSAVNDSWPLEKIAQLTALVEAGHGSPTIARIMGISRNSVCGKVHRLDLVFKGVAAHKVIRERKPRKPHRAGAVTLSDMPRWCGQCGGILGPEQQRFCSIGCNLIHLAANRPITRQPSKPRAPKPPPPQHVHFGPVHECCFPLNDGRPWKFCSAETEPGRPYCAEHWQVTHIPKRVADTEEAFAA